jgi:hypothetical protein
MLTALVQPALVIAAMLAIYALAFSSRARITPFRLARARTRARSATTSNGLLLLAGISLAALVYELSSQAARLHLPATTLGDLIAVFALTAILLMTVVRSIADLVIGAVGIASTLFSAYAQGGIAAVIAVLLLSMLTLFILGLARGFFRPL